jgi:hypothetical protein
MSSSASSSHSSSASSSGPSSASSNDPAKSPSSLLTQLSAVQAKHESLLKAQSASSSPSSTSPLDAVLPLYSSLLTPLHSLTASSPFLNGASSPLLVDGLLVSLNRCREVRGSMPLVLLHLKALTSLATVSKGYARLLGQKPVVLATVGTMKVRLHSAALSASRGRRGWCGCQLTLPAVCAVQTYAKLRKVLLDCLQLLFAIVSCTAHHSCHHLPPPPTPQADQLCCLRVTRVPPS